MKNTILVGLAIAATALPTAANAADFTFRFDDSVVSGLLTITYAPNPNTGVLPGTAPNPVDPIGSYIITGISGTFSDANLGIVNAAITGLIDLNQVDPEPSNLLAPNSFSLLPVANGVPSPEGLSLGYHYDNLFYPAGSPQAATDYPFHGGVFDIYGVAFTIEGGMSVNFWSNGVQPVVGLNYGVALTDGIDVTDYVNGLSITPVPEPASWVMMIGGFGLVGGAMRRRRTTVNFA